MQAIWVVASERPDVVLGTGGYVSGTVALATNRGTLSPVTDNNDGTYTATLTSSTSTGTATITGTLNAAALANSTTVAFIVGPAAKYIVASSDSAPVAGTSVTITAQLADANDNHIATAGRVVTWSKTGAGGSFSAPTSTTDTSGIATVTFTTSTTAGTAYTVTADDGSVSGASSSLGPAAGARSGCAAQRMQS